MKQHSHRKVLGATVVAAALLLSACGASGGDDSADKKDDKTTTTKPETTTEGDTSTTAPTDDEAQARAESVDLTVSDFPDGWTASAHDSSDEDDNPMNDCDPSFSEDTDKLAKHYTDDFALGSLDEADGTMFTAETVVFTDADTADAAIEVLNDPEVVSCLDDALQSIFTEGNDVTISGELAEDDLDIGTDNSAGLSATYTLTGGDGSTASATVALLAMSTGDVATMVTILSLGENLDPTTLAGPIQTLATLQGEA